TRSKRDWSSDVCSSDLVKYDSGFLVILIYMFVLFYIMVALNKIRAKVFKWERNTESASILASGFMNSGNYGLPVVLFSVGQAAEIGRASCRDRGWVSVA